MRTPKRRPHASHDRFCLARRYLVRIGCGVVSEHSHHHTAFGRGIEPGAYLCRGACVGDRVRPGSNDHASRFFNASDRAEGRDTSACCLGNQRSYSFVWNRPRPFVAGIGFGWIPHAATSSFPSDHLTVQWAVAGVLVLNRRTRLWGVALALLGLPMAWARVYLGDHYLGDMLGAAVMGLLAALFAGRWRVSSANDEAFLGSRD